MNQEYTKPVTSNENVPIKPSANEQAIDPRNNTPMVNNQVIPGQVVAVPIVYNQLPVQIFGDEIQAKIMTSHYCYIKQDLESFFSACLGCCADFFKYKVYVTNESKTEIDKIDGAIFRVTENEDFCMRMNCFCSQFCKPGSLYIRPLNSDNIVAHFHFPYCTCCDFKCECCYRLGPPYNGYYGAEEDYKFGSIRDREHCCYCINCCTFTYRLYDIGGNSRIIIEKICCQPAGCLCPFAKYYPLKYNIIYDGELAGTITRNAKAFCCGPKLYFFEITFPAKATFEERMLLIGFTLKIFYNYYSQVIDVRG